MKGLKYVFLLGILFAHQSCASLNTRNVVLPDDLIYQQRLLLIFTPRQDMPLYQREEEMLVTNVEGLASRDVQVYRLFKRSGLNPENKRLNAALVLNLRREYQVREDQFMNILIGKDGQEKFRREGFLEPQALFDFIDTLYVE